MSTDGMSLRTETGTVRITSDGVVVPKTAGTRSRQLGQWASLLGQTRLIPFAGIHSVAVGDGKAKFLTGARAAGIAATGGLALIGPWRTRATLAIATTDAAVLEFRLLRKDAKRAEAIALAFSARGVTVA